MVQATDGYSPTAARGGRDPAVQAIRPAPSSCAFTDTVVPPGAVSRHGNPACGSLVSSPPTHQVTWALPGPDTSTTTGAPRPNAAAPVVPPAASSMPTTAHTPNVRVDTRRRRGDTGGSGGGCGGRHGGHSHG